MKLFDFGLAKRLGSNNDEKTACGVDSETEADLGKDKKNSLEGSSDNARDVDDATYDMSGKTGTLRYMAREVYLEEPYGAKAGVYSLSIVMHQVLSLLQPFASVPLSQFESAVIEGRLRPAIDANWPRGVRELLERM